MKNNKIETGYNLLLEIITIISIVLYTIFGFKLIKYIFDWIFGSIERLKGVKIGGIIELASLGSFFVPVAIILIILFFVTYIVLLIYAYKTRKIETRKIKFYDLLYLIGIEIILAISVFSCKEVKLLYYIGNIAMYLGYLSIIILIIILIINRKKK